jgi:CHAD domain-containing protein
LSIPGGCRNKTWKDVHKNLPQAMRIDEYQRPAQQASFQIMKMRHNFGIIKGGCKMKDKDLKEAVQLHVKKAGKSFRKLHHDFDSEDIHDFRVEIKKIRAMLRLAEFAIDRKGEMKIPKKLKRFYRTVGNIRSLQLHAKKIGETANKAKDQLPDFYLQLLEGRTAVNIDMAKKKRRQLKGIKKEMGKLVKLLPKDINDMSARTFIQFELRRLKDIQSKQFPSDTELHEARKIMKDILYNWEFIQFPTISFLPASIQKKEKVEGFVERLGDYHDDAVSLDMFNDLSVDQDPGNGEKSELKKIAHAWKEEKAQLHDEIMAAMKKISLNVMRKSLPRSVKIGKKSMPPSKK